MYVQNILEQKKITQGTEGFCEQSCNHNGFPAYGEQDANAVINMWYDANEVMSGVTEVLVYGTAVVVEKV